MIARAEDFGRGLRSWLTEPSAAGIAGIVLGVLAFFSTIPPVDARSIVWPIALGAAAALAGVWPVLRGERRLGWGAAAAGAIGAVLGILCTRSSTAHLDEVFTASLIASMLVFATPLIYAAIGGMFSERSGVVNIGLEGMMLMGAFWGIYGADKTDSWAVGVLIAMLAGGGLALVHAYFAIHLRADQIVGGTAVNFLALGITGYFFVDLYGGEDIPPGTPKIPNVAIPWIKDQEFLGPAIGRLNLMIWLAFGLVVLSYIVMFKTPLGLRIRACGEHPRAADTVGINVFRVRYAAVVASGMLAAMGGAYLSIGFVGKFTENMTAGRGFIALAALIFGNWRPFGAAAAGLLFGMSTALAFRMQAYNDSLPGIDVLIQMLPYALTLIAVAGVIGRSVPPKAVGRPYQKQ